PTWSSCSTGGASSSAAPTPTWSRPVASTPRSTRAGSGTRGRNKSAFPVPRLSGMSTPVRLSTRMPTSGPLRDSFGRVHSDLRISVTDRCNFRCIYCMPEEGMQWLPRSEILTFEEIARVARVAHGLGVDNVRLTGGEPLVRAQLPVLVRLISEIGFSDLSLTTNGVGLPHLAQALAEAGLKRINVSCDSLR